MNDDDLSMDNIADPLMRVNRRMSIIGDRVKAVVKGESRGIYLHGRGGTGKTVKVISTLDEMKCEYEYFAGKITPGGLRELISNCVDRAVDVIVFDDVAVIMENKDAVQLLLAVLDGKPIKYQRAGQPLQTIEYHGGIIFISNEEVPKTKSLAAFQTRVRMMDYGPTDDELAAIMREWASGNGGPPHRGLDSTECMEVIEFLISESITRLAPLDLRLVRKCYSDYRMSKRGETENHWKVLVVSEIQQAVVAMNNPKENVQTREERLKSERDIARAIMKETESRAEQLKLWSERTGHDDRRFDRRKGEVVRGL